MARIFISHSSHNNQRAIHVSDWLSANGWEDVFLDPGPERGIAAGERWKALPKAAQQLRGHFMRLCRPEWLASPRGRPRARRGSRARMGFCGAVSPDHLQKAQP